MFNHLNLPDELLMTGSLFWLTEKNQNGKQVNRNRSDGMNSKRQHELNLNSVKLPQILEHAARRETLERRIQRQAMTYTLWKTPPLRSVYIRWKISRTSAIFCQSDRIKRFFEAYGPVERVVFCSEKSAIIVFKLIGSACTAASTSASWQFSQYHLHVIWLPEYLQVPIQKRFCLK